VGRKHVYLLLRRARRRYRRVRGPLDDVRIYDRVLDASELATVMGGS
jgi:hypothetical protein